MITQINSILLINVLIVNCVNVLTLNNNIGANSSAELKIDKSQQHFPLMNSKSREVRGVYYSHPYSYPFSHPLEEHEYHESLEEPKYIIKVVAPPKRTHDAGVRELLLVLAPLAVIPLIGSAALTTFTAMFASNNFGKRRKRRDLLTRELLSRSFTEVQPRADDYVSRRLIGSQHNVGLESLLATTHIGDSIGADINSNAKRHTFPDNDLIQTKIETSFGSQTAPKSVPIGVKEENNWQPIDTNQNERTGGPKSTGIMSNTSHSLENKDYKSVASLLNDFRDRSTQSMISSVDQSLAKPLAAHIKAQAEQNTTQVQPFERQQYKSRAYLKRTDTTTEFIVKNNNTSNESVSTKIDSSENSDQNKYYRNFRDVTDLGHTLHTIDISAQESEAIDKRVEESFDDNRDDTKSHNQEKRDEHNTWIPFLSNPYLLDATTKGQGNRAIEELDIIQKYLNAKGRPDYNDEIIATYLSCNGMLSASNQCLERLTCQFSDHTGAMKEMERDVSSLVIYSLLKNQHIDNGFKTRLQRAAFFGKDNPGKCNFYNCPKNTVNKNQKEKR